MLLRDDIYSSLRQEILSCNLPPGSELHENDLAERFSVSKSPVREALLRLERDRLVEVISRQGYRVMPISVADARNMYSFRAVLETACAVEAARRATDEQLKALNRFRARPRDDGFIAYNQDFHGAIFEASQNQRMAAVARELIEQMDRMTRISIHAMRDHDPSRLVKEHCEIIDALQARDGRAAAKILRNHIINASRRVLKALGQAAVTE
ncbi:MAG: GntR family transcriptional regulator [Alphaproteobacteria bacterium]|nr:GntR family transcriptional regulator [Alphaproteobacteria bacterium]